MVWYRYRYLLTVLRSRSRFEDPAPYKSEFRRNTSGTGFFRLIVNWRLFFLCGVLASDMYRYNIQIFFFKSPPPLSQARKFHPLRDGLRRFLAENRERIRTEADNSSCERELVAAASRLWDQLSPDQRLAYRDQQQPAEVAPTPDKVSANSWGLHD